jgi:hypothetical protein
VVTENPKETSDPKIDIVIDFYRGCGPINKHRSRTPERLDISLMFGEVLDYAMAQVVFPSVPLDRRPDRLSHEWLLILKA